MSNINTLIAYLNPKKHKGGSSGTLEYHFIKIDEDFLNENQDVLSKNITKSIKKKLEDPLSSPYTQINASSVLYVEVKASEISYYFQKEINGVTKYLTLENLLNNQVSNDFFVTLDDSNFVKIEEQDQLYYHKAQEAIYIRNTQLAEIQIFSKRALYYNPKELGGLTNQIYNLDYKNAKGYKGGFMDAVLGSLAFEFDKDDFDKRQVLVELNPKEGNLYWYPDKVISNNNKVTLFYDYHPTENDDFEVDPYKEGFAIKLTFKNVEGFLGFMMVTYFQNGISILDTSEGSNKYNFCKKYLDIIYLLLERSKNNINDALTYLYYIPLEVFETEVLKYRGSKNKESTTFGASYLWKTIGIALEGFLTNHGVNNEDIVLKLLHGIKITQKDEEYKSKEKNDEVLKQLLTRKTKLGNSYLLTLYALLNTSSFVVYSTFIYKLWRNSSFTDPANEVFNKTSPLVETENSNTPRLILPYKTNKLAGFYSSNMNLEFTEIGNIVVTPHESVIADVVKTLQPDLRELIEIFTEEDWQSEYHPLQPVFIADASKDKAIAVQRFSPMLLLKANEDKSFWSNMATAGEYGVDAITTLSGVGNLAKFRHLARIVKAAETLNKSNKFIRTYTIYKTVKGAAAGAEITSGTVNTLLKITNVKEKELGKAINEFLFWLELASLSGEVGAALKKGLQKSAKTIVENTDDLEKYLDDLIKKGELDEVDKTRIKEEIIGIAGDIHIHSSATKDPIKVKAFEEGLKKLSKISPKEAYKHLEEALPYFNHKVVNGEVIQVSDENCVNVVQVVEDYLRTGKVRLAEPSGFQSIFTLRDKYESFFQTLSIPKINEVMKEGERGIVYGIKSISPREKGHVFNVIKNNGKLHMVDGQSGKLAVIQHQGYKQFKYLKTN
ncbi:hypothetical protein [Tenacibaculum singaporense]|uniref:hypothetical protein n=1 Tax=Tenacibaculum singaporense TaxID=2358479 RepID=UPI000F6829B6|nr:hypothetical protein [Tenacibaculum singaporense]RSC95046.1 hypothetical protein EI424_05205 [Tenacibaculum singaporense]